MFETLTILIRCFTEDDDCPLSSSDDDRDFEQIDMENDGIGPEDLHNDWND